MTEAVFTETVKTRISPERKRQLEEIVKRNLYSKSVSNHIRIAIDLYIQRETQHEQEQSRVAA